MQNSQHSRIRLVESKAGALMALLLAMLWVGSMSAVDGHASSFMPVGWGIFALLLVAWCAIAIGQKVVRMSVTGWLCLAVGAYFLVRSMLSPSLVEGWVDTGLLLGGFVCFFAGVYYGQVKSSKGMGVLLAVAIAANLLAMWLMQCTDLSIRWLGRPDYSLCGENTRNTTLFIYKNFSGLFLMLAGALSVWRVLWSRCYSVGNVVCLVMGVLGMVASFFCGTRVVWLLLPVLAGCGILLWIMLRVIAKQAVGGWLAVAGFVPALCLLVFVADLFMEHGMLDGVLGVNSHLRFMIWADSLRAAADAPLCGYGAAATQWVIAPYYGEWQLPNYAHNEYLQSWVDYGLIGVLLMFAVLLLLVVQGLRAVWSEYADHSCRCKAALALLCVLALAVAAFTDFVWHSFALVGMMAFACGVLASPYPRTPMRWFDSRNWAPGSRPRPRPLRAQSGFGKLMLLTVLGALAYVAASLASSLHKGWLAQWKYNEMVELHASVETRRDFLLQTVYDYPDTRLADHYVFVGPGEPDWVRFEQALRFSLQHNPRQIFTATMLADMLQRRGAFEEAEYVYRNYYPADGPMNCLQNCWATFYATNLLRRAQLALSSGNAPLAHSLFDHAEAMFRAGVARHPSLPYRSGPHTWVDGGTPERKAFFSNCSNDFATLRAIGIPMDHSWKAPCAASPKSALYLRCLSLKN